MSNDMKILKEKFEVLINYNPTKWKLDPPLTEKQVIGFEKTYDILLPEDYRQFLLEVGQPNFLMTLDKAIFASYHWYNDSLPQDLLKRPFLHTKHWREPQLELDCLQQVEVEKNAYGGWLAIANAGCTVHDILIITGIERGNIWSEDLGGGSGFMPYVEFEGKVRYAHHLDEPYAEDIYPHVSFYIWYANG